MHINFLLSSSFRWFSLWPLFDLEPMNFYDPAVSKVFHKTHLVHKAAFREVAISLLKKHIALLRCHTKLNVLQKNIISFAQGLSNSVLWPLCFFIHKRSVFVNSGKYIKWLSWEWNIVPKDVCRVGFWCSFLHFYLITDVPNIKYTTDKQHFPVQSFWIWSPKFCVIIIVIIILCIYLCFLARKPTTSKFQWAK